mgnify:CR=1 FL=1
MNDFQLLNIIVFGLVAGFIAFRLYSVLGRRTGQERSPDDELRLPGGTRPNPAPPPAKDNVVTLPERAALDVEVPSPTLAGQGRSAPGCPRFPGLARRCRVG